MARSRRVYHGRAGSPPLRERSPALHSDSTPRPEEAPVSQSSNQPRRIVYALIERPSGRTHWLRIGIAFVNRDGSENVLLDAIPLSGKLQIREEDRKDEGSKPSPSPPPESGA